MSGPGGSTPTFASTWPDRARRPHPARLAHDGGSLEAATGVRRVGACLPASGNVMCQSYRATGEDSTHPGRARLLFEFASGRRA